MSTDDTTGRGPEPEDIDAEFARLTEGLSLDDAPLTVEDVLSDASAAPRRTTSPPSPWSPPVATAKALAGVIRLGREATDGSTSPPTAPSTPAPALSPSAPTAAAHDPPRHLHRPQRNGIVLFWRRGDRMTATRCKNGEREDISPAIVLGVSTISSRSRRRRDLAEELGGLDPAALTRPRPSNDSGGRKRP